MSLRKRSSLILTATVAAVLCAAGSLVSPTAGQAQAQPAEPVQPWGLPPPRRASGRCRCSPISTTPRRASSSRAARSTTTGNFWFVAIGTGWVSYLTPDAKLVPAFNCDPPRKSVSECEPQGTRWHDGKLYLTTRHLGVMVYDPQTKKLEHAGHDLPQPALQGPERPRFRRRGQSVSSPIPGAPAPGRTPPIKRARCTSIPRDGVLRPHHLDRAFPERHRRVAG